MKKPLLLLLLRQGFESSKFTRGFKYRCVYGQTLLVQILVVECVFTFIPSFELLIRFLGIQM